MPIFVKDIGKLFSCLFVKFVLYTGLRLWGKVAVFLFVFWTELEIYFISPKYLFFIFNSDCRIEIFCTFVNTLLDTVKGIIVESICSVFFKVLLNR